MAHATGFRKGEKVRVSSRRGSVVAPVRFDPGLRPGLAFLTPHFHDQVATNESDDRRRRPEVGDLGIQGDRHPRRKVPEQGIFT